MYRLHGAIHAYGGTTVSARDTADSVITALTPAAWYRNATGVTSAGGFASQWDDYSGNARHLVQATGTNQPAYAAGVFTFDGADNRMQAVFTLTQPTTVVWVGSQVSWTNSDSILDGGNAGNVMRIYQDGSTPNIKQYAGAVGGGSSTSLAVGVRGVVVSVYNGASSSLRVNDNAKSSGDAGAGNGGGITLGSFGSPAAGWGNITAEELIVFPSALSDANQDAVITALNNALTVF